MRRWLDGEVPRVENPLDWPVPFEGGRGAGTVLVTDRTVADEPGRVVLHPPSLVVGVGASTDATADAAAALLDATLAQQGLARESIAVVATIDRRAGDTVVTSLGFPVRAFTAAVRAADFVVGFDRYIDQCAELLSPAQVIVRSPIGAEADRCRDALARAADGARVALVCSGDAGVYAMATLVLELAPSYGMPPVEVVPGVTAATAAAAVLGAPLAHDHAFVSLSDLLTPWETIERRLVAVAESDMAVALYNPRSQRRTWQLERAKDILLAHRPSTTPVGVCTDVGRPDEHIVRTTLAELDPAIVGMLSLVVIGSSTSSVVGDRIVTPRGYEP
jgi:precorrin-3B C17-methyltransferase